MTSKSVILYNQYKVIYAWYGNNTMYFQVTDGFDFDSKTYEEFFSSKNSLLYTDYIVNECLNSTSNTFFTCISVNKNNQLYINFYFRDENDKKKVKTIVLNQKYRIG